jgi:hypothetical protein
MWYYSFDINLISKIYFLLEINNCAELTKTAYLFTIFSHGIALCRKRDYSVCKIADATGFS